MGRFDALLNSKPREKTPIAQVSPPQAPTPEPEKKHTNLLANQQTSKESKIQISKDTSQQTSKDTNQQTSLLASKHTSKSANAQTTKEKTKYGTYLRDDSILAIQLLAVQTQRKDHVVLQEIVDFYFTRKK